MNVVGGIAFLAALTWVVSGLVLALLRRGVQITYLMPMSIKEEQRLNEALRLGSPVVAIAAGLVLGIGASIWLGALTIAIGGAMFAWTLRQRARTSDGGR